MENSTNTRTAEEWRRVMDWLRKDEVGPAPFDKGRTGYPFNPFEGFEPELLRETCSLIREKIQELANDLDPTAPDSTLNQRKIELQTYLGRIQLILQQWKEADVTFEKILKEDPENDIRVAASYKHAADVMIKRQQYEQAHLLLEKALKTDQSQANQENISLALADNLISLGKEEEAKIAFAQLIEAFPGRPGLSTRVTYIYNDRALAFRRENDLDSACRFFEIAFKFSPNDNQKSRILGHWAEALFQLDKKEEAKEKLLAAIQLNPLAEKGLKGLLEKIEGTSESPLERLKRWLMRWLEERVS